MRHPLLLEMAGTPVLCVGGGPVAAAKALPLVRSGAALTVISPTCVEELVPVSTWIRRSYRAGDLERPQQPRLVIAGTGDPGVDQAVAEEADALGIWCLRIDGGGPVSVPSIVATGGVTIAIATGAPALTRRLREHLEEVVDDGWGDAADVLAGLRADPEVRAALAAIAPEERRRRWRAAVEATLGEDPSGSTARSLLTRQ